MIIFTAVILCFIIKHLRSQHLIFHSYPSTMERNSWNNNILCLMDGAMDTREYLATGFWSKPVILYFQVFLCAKHLFLICKILIFISFHWLLFTWSFNYFYCSNFMFHQHTFKVSAPYFHFLYLRHGSKFLKQQF